MIQSSEIIAAGEDEFVTSSSSSSIFHGYPRIRWIDLNENSTRFDYMVAGPTENSTIISMWWGFGPLLILTIYVVGLVILSILRSPQARASSFNLYLVAVLLPDLIFALLCISICWTSALSGYMRPQLCQLESWMIVNGITANAWMNVAIIKQVHTMLRHGHQRKRYFPPTPRRVCAEAIAVYIAAAILGCLPLIPPSINILPLRIGISSGFFCAPVEYDIASSLFFHLFFFQLMGGIPLLYAGYVFVDVLLVSKLMPRDRRARQFALYLMRIVLVFFIWWIPALLFLFVIPKAGPPWFKWSFANWVHAQALASASMCLLKPDVLQAVQETLPAWCNWICCCCCRRQVQQQQEQCNDADGGASTTRATSMTNEQNFQEASGWWFSSRSLRSFQSSSSQESSFKNEVTPRNSATSSRWSTTSASAFPNHEIGVIMEEASIMECSSRRDPERSAQQEGEEEEAQVSMEGSSQRRTMEEELAVFEEIDNPIVGEISSTSLSTDATRTQVDQGDEAC